MTQLRAVAVVVALLALRCGNDATSIARAELDVSPSRLDFFLQGDDSSHTDTLTIRNLGTGELVVTRLEIEGDRENAFVLGNPALFTLAPGAQRNLLVSFVPRDLTRSFRTLARLTIDSNADNAPRREVPLEGEFVAESGGDAGSDAGFDAGQDAGLDGGDDGGDDGGFDGGEDAGSDAGFDGGDDAGIDAGHTSGCEWELAADVEAGSTSSTVADLAIASNQAGFTVGWWTDDRALQVRSVALTGAPSGSQATVFQASTSRFPVWSLAGAADTGGATFFALESTAFADKLHRIDLRGAAPVSSEIDSGYGMTSIVAAPSGGGIASLWRWRVGSSSTSSSEVRIRRDGGSAPIAQRSTGLPTTNTSNHVIAPLGADLAVAWQGGATGISGARLDASGIMIANSSKSLTILGSRNVRPSLASTDAGLVVAWMQDVATDRNASIARLDDSLTNVSGDVVLGVMGPSSATAAGSIAAAASGSLAAVVWTRFDATGAPLGMTVGGVDRATGRVLTNVDLTRTSMARFTDVAIAAVGNDVLVSWVERAGDVSSIRVAHAACR